MSEIVSYMVLINTKQNRRAQKILLNIKEFIVLSKTDFGGTLINIT